MEKIIIIMKITMTTILPALHYSTLHPNSSSCHNDHQLNTFLISEPTA
jgi:hypothetical protein